MQTRETECQQHMLAVAYRVMGINPETLVGDKVKTVRQCYIDASVRVHPDKKEYVDCDVRFPCLLNAYERLIKFLNNNA